MKASVPSAVRRIVTGNKSVHDCMRMNVINYTALAAVIQPEVQRMLGGPVNLNTIVVAIKRYADSFERTREMPGESLRNAQLSLVDGIVDFRMPADEFGSEMTAPLLDALLRDTRDYELFRMTGTVRILAEDAEGTRRAFGARLRDSGNRFVKIGITVPERGSRMVPYVMEALEHNGVETVNVSFDRNSVVLILHERDALRAYEVLRARTSAPG